MDAEELYTKLCGYFGEPSENVVTAMTDEINRIDPLFYLQIFQTITRSRPVKYGPIDVSDIFSAAASLEGSGNKVYISCEENCPVCGLVVVGTKSVCATCGFDMYDKKDRVKISAHLAWWKDWKAGKAPKVDALKGIRCLIRILSLCDMSKLKEEKAQ